MEVLQHYLWLYCMRKPLFIFFVFFMDTISLTSQGLTTACIYYVMSSLEVKAVPDYVLLAANHPVIVSLNSLPPGSDGGGVWVR